MDNQKIWEIAAQKIEEKYSHYKPGFKLPTAAELAEEICISRPNILKALQNLKAKGFLSFHKGQGARIAGSQSESLRKQDSKERLYIFLKTEIEKGNIKVDESLPKIAFLANRYKVSQKTVTEAYAKLEDVGLVRRIGRQALVGKQHEFYRETVAHKNNEPPKLFIVSKRMETWRTFIKAKRTQKFAFEFSNQIRLYGIETIHCYFERVTHHNYLNFLNELGLQPLLTAIKKGGDACKGVLIAASRQELPELNHWVQEIKKHHIPIVWFDRYDEEPLDTNYSDKVYRCFFSEFDGIRRCLQYLVDLGHKEAAYPQYFFGEWEAFRLQKIQEVIRQDSFDITINVAGLKSGELKHRIEYLYNIQDKWPEQVKKAILKYGKIRVSSTESKIIYDKYKQALKKFTQEQMAYVNKKQTAPKSGTTDYNTINGALYLPVIIEFPQCTAVLTPNDELAFRYTLAQLNDFNITTPDKMSLLSFDNSFSEELYKITSVDFGFGYLGYWAFHAIMQDLPLPNNNKGEIRGKATIAHGGSTGAPRKGPLWG